MGFMQWVRARQPTTAKKEKRKKGEGKWGSCRTGQLAHTSVAAAAEAAITTAEHLSCLL